MNIDSGTFTNDKCMAINQNSPKYGIGIVLFRIKGIDYDYNNFPTGMVLNYPVNNFKVYINQL